MYITTAFVRLTGSETSKMFATPAPHRNAPGANRNVFAPRFFPVWGTPQALTANCCLHSAWEPSRTIWPKKRSSTILEANSLGAVVYSGYCRSAGFAASIFFYTLIGCWMTYSSYCINFTMYSSSWWIHRKVSQKRIGLAPADTLKIPKLKQPSKANSH